MINISFIIPSYNDLNNISKVIFEINKAMKLLSDGKFEIIIIDDFSPNFINSNIPKFKNVLFYRNKSNLGFGGSFKVGLKYANFEYVMLLPSDNSHKFTEIYKIVSQLKQNSVVTTYYVNSKDRRFLRYLFTLLYTPLINFIFNLNLKYYNGINCYKREYLNNLSIPSNFAFQIEILIQLKKKNIFIKEVPTILSEDTNKKSNAFTFKNSILVLKTIFLLFYKYRILNKI